MLPTFLIIGAQKSATSSLWAYLRAHPQVFMPLVKELDFFSAPGDDLDIEGYAEWFSDASNAVAIGEASPSYTMFPASGNTPAKIARALPGARLIYLMRHPVERMRSAYRHRLAGATERRRIGRALIGDPSYLQVSMYATQVEQYLRWFPRSQLLLLTTEELKRDRAATLQRVLSFIGVDTEWEPPDLHAEHNTSELHERAPRAWVRVAGDVLVRANVGRVNANVAARAIGHPLVSRRIRPRELTLPADVREQLITAIRPEVVRLAALMPPTFDGWGLLP